MTVFFIDIKQHQVKMYRNNSFPSNESNFQLRNERNHFHVPIDVGYFVELNVCECVSVCADAFFVCNVECR